MAAKRICKVTELCCTHLQDMGNSVRHGSEQGLLNAVSLGFLARLKVAST